VAELELRLDAAIDALNAEGDPPVMEDDLEELVVLARVLRSLPAGEWPDPAFPRRLATGLAGKLVPARRRRRPRIRIGVGMASAVAAAAALIVVISLNRPASVSAAMLARQTLTASSGQSLGPVRFTQVTTNSVPHGIFEPVPPPPRIVEHVVVADSNRWRVQATITEANGEGTTTVLTVRNGDTIVTVTSSPSEGQTETRRTAGAAAELPSASAYGAQIDSLTPLEQTRGHCARRLSPVEDGPRIAGRATQLLRLGATACPSADMPELNGPATFIVDRQTHLVLEAEIHSASGQLTERVRTTALTSGAAPAARLFRLPKPLAKARQPIRPRIVFTPQLPTNVPAALHAGPMTPVSTQAATGKTLAFTVTYRSANGHAQLQLYEAAASTPSVHYPGRQVVIRPGVVGTYSSRKGLAILWWIHDGVYLSLQQRGSAAGVPLAGSYPLATLLQIASSAS
jgi:hypothetical protein